MRNFRLRTTRRSHGLTPVDKQAIIEVNFIRDHPEMNHYVGMLMSTVTACKESHIYLPHIPLEKAYVHVFGSPKGVPFCPRCKQSFEEKKKMQENLYLL